MSVTMELSYIRLIDFLNKNNVIFPAQFGFQENHSTSHALILIVDKIQKAIEAKLVSCGIFLDFCKAFDTVDHSILLYKLQHYGIISSNLR
jgi:retron-type reverse transcriptase